MFGWLRGKKEQPQAEPTESEMETMRSMMAAAAVGENVRLVRAASQVLKVDPTLDAQFLAAELAAALTLRLVRMNEGSLENGETAFAAGIFVFCACNHLTRIMDEDFEIAASLGIMSLCGDDADKAAVVMQEVVPAYNQMTQANDKIIQAIGHQVAKWTARPTQENLGRMSDLFAICVKSTT